MPAALLYATQLLGILPALISAGKDITDLVTTGNAALQKMQAENRVPTDQEWADLNAQIAALQKELHS